jgi:hypothetical protein
MSKKKYKDREWLYEKYVEEGLTNVEIADICDVSDSTICLWKKKFDIPSRDETPERVKEKIAESVSQHIEQNGHPFKGKSHTEKSKNKISESKSGENHQFYGESRPEFAEKVSGSNNPAYKDGRSEEYDFRKSNKWQNFSFKIKEKSNWTCQNCGSHGSEEEIQTHHTRPVSEGGDKYSNLFIVLCKDCHDNKSSFWHNSTVAEQLAEIDGGR